jgi:hypothetical protein
MNLKRWRKLLYLLLIPAALAAQTNVNSTYLSSPLTATSQTSAPINLSNRSWSAGTIQLTGVSLTTATFGVLGSSDPACGSTTFQPIAINLFSTPGTVATTMTATATALYQVNLAGLYCIEYQTSGTFTATSITLLLTASPNAIVGRSGGGSGSAVTAVSIVTANGFSGTSSGGTTPALTINALTSSQVTTALGFNPGAQPNVVTTSTFTFSGAAGFYDNENSTAGTAVTGTLPTASVSPVVLQYCFDNANNGSAANTGVLTFQTSATGQYIIFTDGTLSASGGYVSSGGAARDAGCVRAVDSTHWMFYTNTGTWTKH